MRFLPEANLRYEKIADNKDVISAVLEKLGNSGFVG
jgi:hypothetical protein